jgi:hypothetical protein
MRESRIVLPPNAGVAELADALDSKSSGRKVVWVRAPPPAMNSQFNVRCRMFSVRRNRPIVGTCRGHLGKNASRQSRMDLQLYAPDISAVQFPG